MRELRDLDRQHPFLIEPYLAKATESFRKYIVDGLRQLNNPLVAPTAAAAAAAATTTLAVDTEPMPVASVPSEAPVSQAVFDLNTLSQQPPVASAPSSSSVSSSSTYYLERLRAMQAQAGTSTASKSSITVDVPATTTTAATSTASGTSTSLADLKKRLQVAKATGPSSTVVTPASTFAPKLPLMSSTLINASPQAASRFSTADPKTPSATPAEMRARLARLQTNKGL